MKYRFIQYTDGYEYESFLDDKVPGEYKDIVVDKLPQAIIDEETRLMQKAEEDALFATQAPGVIKDLQARITGFEKKLEVRVGK